MKKFNLGEYTEAESARRTELVRHLRDMLRDDGYFYLYGHGLSGQLVRKAMAASQSFFGLPAKTKESYSDCSSNFQRGYTGLGPPQAIHAQQPDAKEYWQCGLPRTPQGASANDYPANVWPRETPDLKLALMDLLIALNQMASRLTRALDEALDTGTFLQDSTKFGNSVIRCLHYPETTAVATSPVARAAPHCDIDFLTILVAETSTGMQFRSPHGYWLDVTAASNRMVVASGEMLWELLTKCASATSHRVVTQPDGVSRHSIVYLLHPRPDVLLRETGRNENSEATTAREFLRTRIRYWSESDTNERRPNTI